MFPFGDIAPLDDYGKDPVHRPPEAMADDVESVLEEPPNLY